MANYTKYILMEQIRYKLSANYPNILETVQPPDIIAAIGQKINAVLKLQYLAETLATGDTIPENLMIATYENIEVTSYGGKKSRAYLPVQPVSLPRNMGIYMVSPDEDFDCIYIPLQAGQANLLKGQRMISNILGQVGYEVYGNYIVMTQDITIDEITSVNMRLLVSDISQYDDYTPLPIPADYAQTIIEEVYKSFLTTEQAAMNKQEMTQNVNQIPK